MISKISKKLDQPPTENQYRRRCTVALEISCAQVCVVYKHIVILAYHIFWFHQSCIHFCILVRMLHYNRKLILANFLYSAPYGTTYMPSNLASSNSKFQICTIRKREVLSDREFIEEQRGIFFYSIFDVEQFGFANLTKKSVFSAFLFMTRRVLFQS